MGEQKKRHGCLTAWLVLAVVGAAFSALLYIFAGGFIGQYWPKAPVWAIQLNSILCIGQIICVVALLKWKKWGFYGLIGISVVCFVNNIIIGLTLIESLLGLGGILIFYWLLKIGKEKNGWSQLE